jgi:uncharacterized Tic20 family protein
MPNTTPQPAPILQPETTPDIHTYKFKPCRHLLNLFALIFTVFVMVIPLIFFIPVLVFSHQPEKSNGAFQLVLLCGLAPILILYGFVFIQMVVSNISMFFSYIKITPEGIEHKVWPYRHIRSNWVELDRLGKFLLHDVIYLKSYTVIGFSLSYVKPFVFFNNLFQNFIILSSYKGWPNGQLADDLKRCAPQLFEYKPSVEKIQAQETGSNSEAPGISQENRLLAALAHASVLFSTIGILVPLAIYFIQKKKSGFLAFHALQAFFFQLIGNLLGLLVTFCVLGVIFVPAIGASMVGNEKLFASFLGIVMLITVAISLLMSFGSTLYGLYGIIAAILTYQGKDFRYVIIGDMIRKKNQPDQPANTA